MESGLDEAGQLILIVQLLKLRRRDVADRLQQSFAVVPAHPIQRRELDIVESLPRRLSSDDFDLVQADYRLGERVVIGIPDAPD